MDFYICGINSRLALKVLWFCQIYFLRFEGVPEFDRNVLITRKVNAFWARLYHFIMFMDLNLYTYCMFWTKETGADYPFLFQSVYFIWASARENLTVLCEQLQ